jgi:hypothetical protein
MGWLISAEFKIARRLNLPTTSTNTPFLGIRFTQAFYCALDGRVCSGKSDRLLDNELGRGNNLRTQNGILRQVSMVAHVDSLLLSLNPRLLCFNIAS